LLAGCSSETTSNDSAAPTSKAGDDKIELVMIPKATQATFWNHVRKGAERAAEEFDVDLTWRGPAGENDRAEQKKVFQQSMNAGFDGILLAPTDSIALAPDVRTAIGKKIPVLIFDSAIEGDVGVSYVATDNLAAGRMGGKKVMELVGQGGKVILFRHMEGHASTTAREEGALEEFKAANAEILVENRYSGPNQGEAQKTAMFMIDDIRAAEGIFASNQTAAEGLLTALRQTNRSGKIRFVGFDSSELLIQGLRNGEIDALVVQDPVSMGYTSVKLMVDHLKGEDVEKFVNTGAHLVTRENMDDPEIAPLIEP
jgi:ribose transport system substrate-binding protein